MSARVDETDAAAYVATSATNLIKELALLRRIAECPEEVSPPTLREADMPIDLDPDEIRDAAEERLDELPLAVEATTTFEVVLGTGGPDRRLCFECDRIIEHDTAPHGDRYERTSYEIRRVFNVYSWAGSAELELYGDDREVAEAFGRRVVPELPD